MSKLEDFLNSKSVLSPVYQDQLRQALGIPDYPEINPQPLETLPTGDSCFMQWTPTEGDVQRCVAENVRAIMDNSAENKGDTYNPDHDPRPEGNSVAFGEPIEDTENSGFDPLYAPVKDDDVPDEDQWGPTTIEEFIKGGGW